MRTPGSLVEFMSIYGTEEACRKALYAHRWPGGFVCPRCGEQRSYLIETRALYECTACKHQVSLTAGTIFHKSKTPLQKWFLAIHLLASTKKAPSAAELGRQLDLAAQTAWTLRRKIVHALTRREGELMFRGVVEADESYVGGREELCFGRRAEKKSVVAVLAQENGDGGLAFAHMLVVRDATKESLTGAVRAFTLPGSTVKTDGLTSYLSLPALGYDHSPRAGGSPKDTPSHLPWVHTVISNFKRWILGTFHSISNKHLQSYLDEFCYRLNRRYQRTDIFRRILNRCCRFFGPVTYAELTAS